MPTIAHVTPYMDPSAGGPPVVVNQLVDHAPDMGWRSLVITTAAFTSDQGRSLAERKGFKVFSGNKALLRARRREQLLSAIGRADVVHCHTLWSPIVSLSARFAQQHGIPYLVSPHGMLDPYSLSQKSKKKRVYLSLFERHMLRNANCLLFTTNAERDLATKQLGAVQATEVISLGAEAPTDSRAQLVDRFYRANPELVDKDQIVFCGRIHEKKRPEALIAAMPAILKAVPSAMLLFVGSGDPGLIKQLESQVQTLGVSHAVRFTGFLTGSDKWAVLAASKLFALPSHQENFGIAVAEAMQIGLPVLLTKRVNIWDEIVEYGGGTVLDDANIVKSLADTVGKLLTDDARCAVLSERARSFAEANYSWRRCAQLTHDLYKRINSAASACD